MSYLTLFQFHKGTIRTCSQRCLATKWCYFNSIKVRLELWGMWRVESGRQFQFHKGTIRTSIRRWPLSALPVFQFHKGTIRTGSRHRGLGNEPIFQFHKGTIRTTDAFFASTSSPDFNSIKVRLEQCTPQNICSGGHTFQFHKGTIRT